jgi:hypothetical protein
MTALAPILEAFFTDRLMTQRGASPHTIASYRDTWGCLGPSGLRILIGSSPERTGSRGREIPEIYS